MSEITILPDIPAPVGRPRKDLNEADWEIAEKLASMLCTMEEISAFFGMGHHSFKRRLAEKYDMNFEQWAEQFSTLAKISLRRAQLKLALDGNAAMLQHLGKVYLEQKPSQKIEITDESQYLREAWGQY
jgi:hypothetical protein